MGAYKISNQSFEMFNDMKIALKFCRFHFVHACFELILIQLVLMIPHFVSSLIVQQKKSFILMPKLCSTRISKNLGQVLALFLFPPPAKFYNSNYCSRCPIAIKIDMQTT